MHKLLFATLVLVKRGSAPVLLFWIVLLGVMAYAGYYIWTNYSKVPNESTRKTASSLQKYPTASSWQLQEAKNLCVIGKSCAQPIKILFETNNAWNDIYAYYVAYFRNEGWSSNSNIVTSTPTTAVFYKGNCQATIENHGDIKYSITVACTR